MEVNDYGHAVFTVEKKGCRRSIDCYGTIKVVEKKYVLFQDNDEYLYLVGRKHFKFAEEEFKILIKE